ncbi:MAG: flagellar protein FliS [Lachnospiraceae bacterium]|nr:flagellar protein FliS [Lachnospiraceae bacterium]
MTDEMKQEYTMRIANADKTVMTVILYDMALEYIEEAGVSLDAGDKQEFKRKLTLVRGCVNELIMSLDFKYELAMNLYSLYMFVIRVLAKAGYKYDTNKLNEAVRVLKPLRDAYDTVSKEKGGAPVMDNSEKVYQGLTYQKNAGYSSMVAPEANRGMTV